MTNTVINALIAGVVGAVAFIAVRALVLASRANYRAVFSSVTRLTTIGHNSSIINCHYYGGSLSIQACQTKK